MRYARNPTVLWRSTTSGPVILPVDGPRPELLGGLAAVLWELLDDEAAPDALESEAQAFVGHAVSVRPALVAMEERGLVVARPPA